MLYCEGIRLGRPEVDQVDEVALFEQRDAQQGTIGIERQLDDAFVLWVDLAFDFIQIIDDKRQENILFLPDKCIASRT